MQTLRWFDRRSGRSAFSAVASVARRRDICQRHVFRWRHPRFNSFAPRAAYMSMSIAVAYLSMTRPSPCGLHLHRRSRSVRAAVGRFVVRPRAFRPCVPHSLVPLVCCRLAARGPSFVIPFILVSFRCDATAATQRRRPVDIRCLMTPAPPLRLRRPRRLCALSAPSSTLSACPRSVQRAAPRRELRVPLATIANCELRVVVVVLRCPSLAWLCLRPFSRNIRFAFLFRSARRPARGPPPVPSLPRHFPATLCVPLVVLSLTRSFRIILSQLRQFNSICSLSFRELRCLRTAAPLLSFSCSFCRLVCPVRVQQGNLFCADCFRR